MVGEKSSLDFFAFVGEAHPFAPALEDFRRTLGKNVQIGQALAASGNVELHAEIKAVPYGAGYVLDRFYWSLQRRGANGRVSSHTAYFRKDVTDLTVYDFPLDPYLKTLATCVEAADAQANDFCVLRYVPLRRFTFRSAGRIGKVKRASKLADSFTRLANVHRAATGADFRVAKPLEIDLERCVFFQENLAGRNLADLIELDRLEHQMAQVGNLHAAIHALSMPDVPAWNFGDYLSTLRADCKWITYIFPDRAAILSAVLSTLERSVPAVQPSDMVFCQGDFVVSQLLDDGQSLAVTDLDMARHGERHQEIGKLIASLKYDLPLLQAAFEAGNETLLDTAEGAYLAAYSQRSGRALDPQRLLWFRLCQEIHYLALSLKKDTWRPQRFDRALALVGRLLAGLGTPIPAIA